MYVAVWPGRDVEELNMHPPYNLCLRLLHELTDDILFLAPPDACSHFDAHTTPCASGMGYTVKCSVQRHTASKTSVEVRHML